MENKTDFYATELFFRLIDKDNWKHYAGEAKYGELKFIINNTNIVIRWFRRSSEGAHTNNPITFNDFRHSYFPPFEVCVPIPNGGYSFVLEIDGLRQLKVKYFSPEEEKEVIKQIEEMVNRHEEKMLERLLLSTCTSRNTIVI